MYQAHGHSDYYESHWPCTDCALADLDPDTDDEDEIAAQIYAAGVAGLSHDATEEEREELAEAIAEAMGMDTGVVLQSLPSWDAENSAWIL